MKQIGGTEVGVLTRKRFGRPLPQGQVVARKGELGVQAKILKPGFYWMVPFIWTVARYPMTQIFPNEVGIVESIDGQPLPQGVLVCDGKSDLQIEKVTHCPENSKGRPLGILRPGNYRINSFALRLVKGRVVDDVDQASMEIENGGGRIILPRTQVGQDGYVAYTVDPNGVMMGIFEPSEDWKRGYQDRA